MTSGGSTLDGVNGFMATDDVFRLVLLDGTELSRTSEYIIGIADLGAKSTARTNDGDNYFDVCIADPQASIIGSIVHVRMPCTPNLELYYPKGDKSWAGCTDHMVEVCHASPTGCAPLPTSNPSPPPPSPPPPPPPEISGAAAVTALLLPTMALFATAIILM